MEDDGNNVDINGDLVCSVVQTCFPFKCVQLSIFLSDELLVHAATSDLQYLNEMVVNLHRAVNDAVLAAQM